MPELKEQKEPEREAFITDEILQYLDKLRESGVTNMFGATPYIQEQYPMLNQSQARRALSYWMQTFGTRHPKE